MTTIGKLSELPVRDLWPHEQYDFSAWLAQEDNIKYLSEILGLDLVDINKEVFVGPYRCDIVAKDETTDDVVIIENQLEPTNHDHLGKIVTYAAGLGAKYIVWVVEEAKEEHRAAIEWLNNNTTNGINFFLIEIHAYKIGDSDPAPKFEVIEKPNDFVKKERTSTNDGELNRSRSECLVFWEQFNEILNNRKRPFNMRKASTDNWYAVAVGTSIAHITICLINRDNCIAVEFNVYNKDLFDKLYEQRETIESELGFKMDEWLRMDNNKVSRIKYYIDGLNFDNHANYEELSNKAINATVKIRDTFKKYL